MQQSEHVASALNNLALVLEDLKDYEAAYAALAEQKTTELSEMACAFKKWVKWSNALSASVTPTTRGWSYQVTEKTEVAAPFQSPTRC